MWAGLSGDANPGPGQPRPRASRSRDAPPGFYSLQLPAAEFIISTSDHDQLCKRWCARSSSRASGRSVSSYRVGYTVHVRT